MHRRESRSQSRWWECYNYIRWNLLNDPKVFPAKHRPSSIRSQLHSWKAFIAAITHGLGTAQSLHQWLACCLHFFLRYSTMATIIQHPQRHIHTCMHASSLMICWLNGWLSLCQRGGHGFLLVESGDRSRWISNIARLVSLRRAPLNRLSSI